MQGTPFKGFRGNGWHGKWWKEHGLAATLESQPALHCLSCVSLATLLSLSELPCCPFHEEVMSYSKGCEEDWGEDSVRAHSIVLGTQRPPLHRQSSDVQLADVATQTAVFCVCRQREAVRKDFIFNVWFAYIHI